MDKPKRTYNGEPAPQWKEELDSETRSRTFWHGKMPKIGAATMSDEEFWGRVDETLRANVMTRSQPSPSHRNGKLSPEVADIRRERGAKRSW